MKNFSMPLFLLAVVALLGLLVVTGGFKPASARDASDIGQTSSSFSQEERAAAIDKLTPLQRKVALEDGTEPAFRNRYWDNTEPGLYVDILAGEPLFVSAHKYKSGTGWPSFYRPANAEEIVLKPDHKFGMTRTEVRTKTSDIHLGHVFDDGPPPTGKRYCMNSAAMSFIPKSEMEARGYGEYLSYFEE